ncbi:hypothetical protein CEUSTIGMA_g9621.t1 [Chlamydomonas eustigma]|uniref:Aspartyl/asparaginy/proline hydroxylase domain-containing protein n=1 Tax=Chlamydomonas eustigma TaxID=1157962 RepID=A0A250XGK9_9CHLO|nr:hypothetical protein CEUSTIGMA_g9621.t1 [Chlamydomonas eustigma]|eukprot:GAX82193.1 hypothetical protein CEUSTIGMA_g9621.t1 [Chlamydomonas eustigma]
MALRRQPKKSSDTFSFQNVVVLLLLGYIIYVFLTTLTRRLAATSNSSKIQLATKSEGTHKLRLLLSSHGRIMWYYPEDEHTVVLHQGQGVHYGTFTGKVSNSGALESVWVVLRPHNWHPESSVEVLLELDSETGQELNRVRVPSRFTHDAVRRGDQVYLCNTDEGSVLQLSYPSMSVVKSLSLFTPKQHVNTLAPLEEGKLWALLHNMGKSSIVRIDLTAQLPSVEVAITDVGYKAHGLVEWNHGFVVLDSDNSALVWVSGWEKNLSAKEILGRVKQFWKAEEGGKFLKGLAVVDDVAYFGISVFAARSKRQDAGVDSELAAFDLKKEVLLWRRKVPTKGLLNVVSAPQLGQDSTYRAIRSGLKQGGWVHEGLKEFSSDASKDSVVTTMRGLSSNDTNRLSKGHEPNATASVQSRHGFLSNEKVKAATAQLEELGYPARIGGHWASGLPFLDIHTKASASAWDAGIQLPLTMLNITNLKHKVESMPKIMWNEDEQRKSNAVIGGRQSNTQKYKPGVKAIYLIFSDRSIKHTFRFPYYQYFKDAIEPLLSQVLGEGELNKVVRMQLAYMPPEISSIKVHRDMGGYATNAHRIHIPVLTNPKVTFEICPALEKHSLTSHEEIGDDVLRPGDCLPIPMEEGMVFEVNNRVLHRVRNESPLDRVQLVVDVAEEPRVPQDISPGAECEYVHANVVCR